MKKPIFLGIIGIVMICFLLYFNKNSEIKLKEIPLDQDITFNQKSVDIQNDKSISIKKIKVINEEKSVNNNLEKISEKKLFQDIEKIMKERGTKEFDDFFTILDYNEDTNVLTGTYKIGMLEEVFEKDKLNIPFFDTYNSTVTSKFIDNEGYIQVNANLENDENGYLGLTESKQEKVLTGVIYDYQAGVEYHIEGENGKFKIFPITDEKYMSENDLIS